MLDPGLLALARLAPALWAILCSPWAWVPRR